MKPEHLYKRRIRIEGEYDEVMGYMLRVIDIETGENVPNVSKATVYLDAGRESKAELTYYLTDVAGYHFHQQGKVAEGTIVVDNPEIILSAFEKFNPDEKWEGH